MHSDGIEWCGVKIEGAKLNFDGPQFYGRNEYRGQQFYGRRPYQDGVGIEQIELTPLDHPREFQTQPVMLPPLPILRDVVDLRDYSGWWVGQHFRRQARTGGYYAVARRLRKQGFPLHVTLAILLP